jgi:hypothetical protein
MVFIAVGVVSFLYVLQGDHPEKAWQTYLINFLFWSAISQGAVLFSAVMHITKARWSGLLSGLGESFAAFFPLSIILFLVLFIGKSHVFPWLSMAEELHGTKRVWLNLPFLFSRDFIGLLFLYTVGFTYVYFSLQLRFMKDDDGRDERPEGNSEHLPHRWWKKSTHDLASIKGKLTTLSILYIFVFTFVLSLIGFDLLMGLEPHWFSTLFGAYCFVKAFYIGLAAIIILAFILYLRHGGGHDLTASHFHDMGKLLFGFCLIWADFFYVKLLVIWYGNIPEETHYVIQRTMIYPWKSLAWSVFIVDFIIPFLVLLNRNIKTKPIPMIGLCAFIMLGIWFEHLLLVGPALSPTVPSLPLNIIDGLISLGFFGLMAFCISVFFRVFPELYLIKGSGVELSGGSAPIMRNHYSGE